MNTATLFFYGNNEYLLTEFLDEEKFRFEGIEIKNTPMYSFLEILSDYDKIQNIIEDSIYYIEEERNETELYNYIVKVDNNLSNINKCFKIFSIEKELLSYKLQRENLRKTLYISTKDIETQKYVKDFFIDYHLKLKNIKKSIDAYYNINNDKLVYKLSPAKRLFYLKSKEIELMKSLIIPKSKQFICIEHKNNLLPAESFIYKMNDINALSMEEIERQYTDNSNNNKVYKYISNHKVYNVTVFELSNFWEFLNAYFYYLTNNNIHINKCKNCNKYFIPANKSNETLCDNIYKNRKDLQGTILRNKITK